ncbi:Retrovirus-related Pol polyprotein from transposon TNT 1-94 [Abeliophyllum distichum]|uniref:Retrovirus-related Pol polyprotein from transposon TNT 1-94 n=1 Tax=Abeliophyllum distichum TaxID=126358 RepID=A0ABD1QF41_9LAMI
MGQSNDLADNVDIFNKLVQDIVNCGEKVSEEYKAIILLNFIPEIYKEVKNAIRYGRDTLTPEIVIDSHRSKEMDVKVEKDDKKSGNIHMMRGRTQFRQTGSQECQSSGGEFDMKDLGKAKRILSMEIERDRSNSLLRLHQTSYVLKVLKIFDMNESKPVTLCLANYFVLSKDQSPVSDEDVEYMNIIPYSNAIGSIMYLMVCTRFDLAYAVSTLSMFMSNLGLDNWEALKWVLRYLRGSSDMGTKVLHLVKFRSCLDHLNIGRGEGAKEGRQRSATSLFKSSLAPRWTFVGYLLLNNLKQQ